MYSSSNRPFAVITGASSGIGFELAKQFAEHNHNLLIAAKSSEIERVAQTFRAYGTDVHAIQVDLATYEGVETLYESIRSVGQPVDAIAINAGVGVGGDFASETDLQDELNLIHLNVTGTVHLAKRVVKDMLERGQGRILFTSSIASLMPGPFEAVYAASKAFVQSFSKALRNELKDTGVSITALLPGATETNFFHRADMDDTKVGTDKKDDPADVAQQGYDALMSNQEEVIAGSLKTKIQGNVTKILPDAINAEQHRQMAEPEGQKHSD